MHCCHAIVRGKRFSSIKEAAAYYGVSERHAHRLLKKFGHLDNLGIPAKRSQPTLRKVVNIHGLTFSSITEAADTLKVSRKTISNATKNKSSAQFLLAAAMRYKRELEIRKQKELQNGRRQSTSTARKECLTGFSR